MQKIIMLTFTMMLVLLVGVSCNQCPTERSTNILKSITYKETNSYVFRLSNIEYDSDSNEYFYLGRYNSFDYRHLLSRMDVQGGIIWSIGYPYHSTQNTLQYSSMHESLFYTIHISSSTIVVIKASSSNGSHLETYSLASGSHEYSHFNRCTLSKDELAYFCVYYSSSSRVAITRLDVNSSRIDLTYISGLSSLYGNGTTILGISYNEVLYSYKTSDQYKHNIFKANYIDSSSLEEVFHRSISGIINYSSAVSCLDDNNETIWHVINFSYTIFYFQQNLTTFSLIGNFYTSASPQVYERSALGIGITEGKICIWNTHRSDAFLLIVDTETQNLIQAYNLDTSTFLSSLYIQNGYINIIGCVSHYSNYCSHDQILTAYGFDNLLSLNTSSSYVFSSTNDYSLVEEATLTTHSISSQSPSSTSFSNYSYSFEIMSNESYVLSLPSSFTNFISITSGQIVTLDLPCKVANFSSTFTCLVTEGSIPSWVTVDCDNFRIEITGPHDTSTNSSFFEIRTTYPDGEIVTSFNVSFPCDYLYCENDSTFGPTNKLTPSILVALIVAGAGVFIGFSVALISQSPAQDAWAIINFLQLILTLPLIALAMKNKVKEFIESNAYIALSVYMLPTKNIKKIPLLKDLSFDQPDEYLRGLGWSSGSTFVNNFILFVIFFELAFIHVILYCIKEKQNMFRSIITKLYKFLTYTVYIRLAIEVYMFTFLMLMSEIKYYIKNEGEDNFGHKKVGEGNQVRGNYVSLTFSCFLLILPISFCMLAFVSWMKNKDALKIDNECKTREFYHGILQVPNLYRQREEDENDERQELIQNLEVPRKVKVARLFSLMFLIRRTILVFITIAIPSSETLFSTKILFVLTLQTTYILYTINIKSFSESKDQMVESLNEFVYLILLILLIRYYSESKWTDVAVHVYIGIILSQLCTLLLVSVANAIVKFIRYVKACKSSHNIPQNDESQSENASEQESNSPNSSHSRNDQFSRNRPSESQGSVLSRREDDNQDLDEEDKKENIELSIKDSIS